MNELQESHDRLLYELKLLIRCIREQQLGDYSPLMDEIFDSEHAIRKAEPLALEKGRQR